LWHRRPLRGACIRNPGPNATRLSPSTSEALDNTFFGALQQIFCDAQITDNPLVVQDFQVYTAMDGITS
jgi:hypothetical protein